MFAKVANSSRLQSVLRVLREHPNGVTGLDICVKAAVMNPGECASELRAQGYEISCVEQEKSASGRRVFRYTLTGEPNETATQN